MKKKRGTKELLYLPNDVDKFLIVSNTISMYHMELIELDI